MKFRTLATITILVAAALGAEAATLNVNNLSSIIGGSPNESLILLDNSGNPLSSGFVALYTFAGPAPSSFITLQSVGSTGQLGLLPLTAATNPGAGAFTGVLSPPNDGSLNGIDLYLVVGTGGTNVGNASALSMIDTGLSFSNADTPGSSETLSYFIDSRSIVVLGSLIDQATADWSFANEPNFTGAGLMAVTPEPSGTLLLGLAGMTLLIRRKR